MAGRPTQPIGADGCLDVFGQQSDLNDPVSIDTGESLGQGTGPGGQQLLKHTFPFHAFLGSGHPPQDDSAALSLIWCRYCGRAAGRALLGAAVLWS